MSNVNFRLRSCLLCGKGNQGHSNRTCQLPKIDNYIEFALPNLSRQAEKFSQTSVAFIDQIIIDRSASPHQWREPIAHHTSDSVIRRLRTQGFGNLPAVDDIAKGRGLDDENVWHKK